MSDKERQTGSKSRDARKKKVTQLGDFKLKKKLGEGGMGIVYLAQQVSLDRPVALKTLSRELSKREDFVKRFIREARSMARLDHPNVVRVYAVDSHKGIHYAAIEYIDGRSAQDWLNELGSFSVGDALNVVIAAATGLKAAHDQNMVHRDIKPDNILITRKGVTKVADFGLAKARDEDNSMTQSGAGLGTPLYMAPEQARSAKHVDQRSDIYALGATLYHMLTGKLPFLGETALELILAKEKGSFVPARTINPAIPERLSLVIEKMLAKEAKHRYKSCDEVLAELTSLNLANPVISFIDGAEPALPLMPQPGASTMAGGMGMTRGGLGATNSRVDAEKRSGATRVEKVWYVQHNDEKGKKTLSKMSTAQALQAIRKGLVTAKSRAKLRAEDNWTPIAQFDEFTSEIEKSIVKARAQEKVQSMASLYKQIDKAERNRHRWRFIRNIRDAIIGYTALIIYLIIIAAFLAAAWMYGEDALNWAKAKAGMDTEVSAPVDSE